VKTSGPTAAPLNDLAELLGFKDEEDMLRQLYKHHSIHQIAAKLGYSDFTIRARLVRAGVKMRPRGGANHVRSETSE
jgi:hypothetical protein